MNAVKTFIVVMMLPTAPIRMDHLCVHAKMDTLAMELSVKVCPWWSRASSGAGVIYLDGP